METLIKEDKSLLSFPKEGEIIQGTVIDKEPGRVFFDIGRFGTGIIYGREFMNALHMVKNCVVGDSLFVKVTTADNDEGFVELSLEDASREITWDELKKKVETGETLSVVITNSNKGGLIANMNAFQAFLPVSQLAPQHYPRVEDADPLKIAQELRKFVGEKLDVRIIDVSSREGKIILSEKQATSQETQKALGEFAIGDVVEGSINGVVDFGAFIKFPAKTDPQIELEGLIHISELDWQIIEHPSRIVSPGDTVQAKIIDIKDGKISLSLKALKEDPWKNVEKKYKKGDVIHGRVAKLNPYGAFVEVEKYIQGLIHISEFGSDKRMKETLEVGKEYDFKIYSLDPEEHRMTLILAKTEEPENSSSVAAA